MSTKLHLDILPKEQQVLWKELYQTPEYFTLYGGTALALQIGHRISIDFDFFTNEKFNPQDIKNEISYLKDAQILQSDKNTLTCLVYRDNKPIQVSFFGDLNLPKLKESIKIDGVNIASCEDVLTTKLKTVIDRASYKDYVDIAIGLESGYSLSQLTKNTKQLYGKSFNNNLSLRALNYFDDIEGIDDKTKKTIKKHLNNYERNRYIRYER